MTLTKTEAISLIASLMVAHIAARVSVDNLKKTARSKGEESVTANILDFITDPGDFVASKMIRNREPQTAGIEDIFDERLNIRITPDNIEDLLKVEAREYSNVMNSLYTNLENIDKSKMMNVENNRT